MSVFFLLDILLIVLIVLFIPIGFWRGVQREALVTLGIFLGAQLAASWVDSWGTALANWTNLRQTGGTFFVAVLLLIGSTFILGYGAGAALPIHRPGMVNRIFGALLAGANGALLLSYALRYIREYLLKGQSPGFLDESFVSRLLTNDIQWLILGAAILFVPIVAVMAMLGNGEQFDGYEDEPEALPFAMQGPARTYPPRAPMMQPVSGDTGDGAVYKVEPAWPGVGHPAQATRPIGPILATNTGYTSPWSKPVELPPDESYVLATNGGDGSSSQATVQVDVNAQHDGEMTLPVELESPPPVEEGKCPNCHADVSAAEVYCPSCGRVL